MPGLPLASGPSWAPPIPCQPSPAALWSSEFFCFLLQVSVTCTPFTEGAVVTGLGRTEPT